MLISALRVLLNHILNKDAYQSKLIQDNQLLEDNKQAYVEDNDNEFIVLTIQVLWNHTEATGNLLH